MPLSDDLFGGAAKAHESDILEIVWNHRWEYDKGPHLLRAIVEQLIARQLPFRLHLLGQRFRVAPSEFAQIQQLLDTYYSDTGIAAGRCGFVELQEDYLQCLRDADVVLSTAAHDFQGLSILEGCALGCAPLAPRRLVYPEYLPHECLFEDSTDLRKSSSSAANILQHWATLKSAGQALPSPILDQFRQGHLQGEYHRLFSSVLVK